MREELTKWANKTFGRIEINDVFNLKENIVTDKEENRIRNTTMFIKKKKGIKQDWLKREIFERWIREIKEIAGDVISMKIISSEGNEMQFLGGPIPDKSGQKKYQEFTRHKYSYMFNLVIGKKYREK